MTHPRVVNLRDLPGGIQLGSQYVGRGSPHGNRFRIGRDGTRAEVIEKFRHEAANRPDVLDWLRPLKDQTLVCHCAPKPCHAEVLVELLQAFGIETGLEDFR